MLVNIEIKSKASLWRIVSLFLDDYCLIVVQVLNQILLYFKEHRMTEI